VTTVEKHDKKSLYHVLLKCHHWFYLSIKFEITILDQRVDEDCNMNIFEMITNISDLRMELVNIELLIFKWYQW
jgi:hypothetical protein